MMEVDLCLDLFPRPCHSDCEVGINPDNGLLTPPEMTGKGREFTKANKKRFM